MTSFEGDKHHDIISLEYLWLLYYILYSSVNFKLFQFILCIGKKFVDIYNSILLWNISLLVVSLYWFWK